MRASTLTLTILALCIWTLPAHAQDVAEKDASEERSVVQVKMQSQIPNTSTILQLPLSLMQRLNDQQPLTNLDVQTSERQTQLSAQFTFESMEAFKQWYESSSTQEIVHMLNEEQNRMSLAVQLMRERDSNE